jgi:hypothetical protein
MKILHLLSALLILTARNAFSMEGDDKLTGQKRAATDSAEQIQPAAKQAVFYDSDDEAPKPTNHDGFKEKIEERLDKSEMHNARCDLQDWVKFCTKNNNPSETANHIPTMWEFYSKIETDAAKKGYKQKIQRSTMAPLAALTRSSGLNPDDYNNKQVSNEQGQL